MTPKEKCDELFEEYYQYIFNSLGTYCVITAKQCALICVDKMIVNLRLYELNTILLNYWQQVKTEIEKL